MHKVHNIITKTYNNGLLQEVINNEIHNYRPKYKYVITYNYHLFWYIISETYLWYGKEWNTSSKYYNKYRLNFMGWLLLISLITLGIFIYSLVK